MEKSKNNLSYICLFILTTYFCTKMLWDRITFELAEYFSIVLLLVGFMYYLGKLRKKEFGLFIHFCLFSIYIVINGIILSDVGHFGRGIYENIFYAWIFFCMIGFLKNCSISNIKRMFRFLGYVGAFLAFLTLIEYVRQVEFISGGDSYTNITGYGLTFRPRVFSRSYLSHGLIMGILAITELYNYKMEKSRKWICFYVLCVFGVLLTSSRGPLVSAVLASVIFELNYIDLKKIGKSKFVKGIVISGIIFVVLYFIFGTTIEVNNSVVTYFLTRVRNIFNWSSDGGNVGRINRWRRYLQYYAEHNVWIGSGLAMAGSSGLSNIMGTTESGVIKRLVELGIIGVFFFYTFLGRIVLQSRKMREINVNIDVQGLKFLAFSQIACILIDDVILQITEEIMISFYLFFFCALLFVCTNYYANAIFNENY